MRRTTLLALAFLGAVLAPAIRADVDIIPERLTLRYFRPDAWDPQTGILHGSISGEPAGTGTVTVQIVPGSVPRPAGLGKFPNTPNRAIAARWSQTTRLNRSQRVFGPVGTSAFSDLLGAVLAQQGYLRIKLNRDLATVKVVKPAWPKTAIDVCPDVVDPNYFPNCCELHQGAEFECVYVISYDAGYAATLNGGCATAGGVPCSSNCAKLALSDSACIFGTGASADDCYFQADDAPPYRCAFEWTCYTAAYRSSFANSCTTNGGSYLARH
jgi:hypothetical protein